MQYPTILLAALLAAGLAGCGAAPQAPASATPAAETTVEHQAAAAYDAYRPAPGSAAAFQDAGGFWYPVYPKRCWIRGRKPPRSSRMRSSLLRWGSSILRVFPPMTAGFPPPGPLRWPTSCKAIPPRWTAPPKG